MPLSLQMDVTYEETKDYLEKVFFFIYVFVNLSMFLFHSEQKNKYTLSELINGFLKRPFFLVYNAAEFKQLRFSNLSCFHSFQE